MHHPWRAFRALTGWRLNIGWLPVGILGVTDFATSTVTLAIGLDQAERRSTIAHEIEHILHGYASCGPREECLVELRAARKLIGIQELGEALAWSRDLSEVADELWVDVQMVQMRLAHLHPPELHYLRSRLDDLH